MSDVVPEFVLTWPYCGHERQVLRLTIAQAARVPGVTRLPSGAAA